MGNMKINWNNIKKSWNLYLAIIITFILWIALWLALEKNNNASEAMVAIGTLILAIVTTINIVNSNAQDNREHKERLLNEVVQWTENVINSSIGRQTIEISELWKTKLEHKYQKAKGKYIDVLINNSFKELTEPFNEVNKKLDDINEFLENFLSGKGGNILALKEYETWLVTCTEVLLEAEAGIKVRVNSNKLKENNPMLMDEDNKEVTLKDIKDLLKSQNDTINKIEERQRKTAWQWIFSLGVSAMAVGISWFLAFLPKTEGDYKNGIYVFGLGLIICVIALCYSNKKKPDK